MLSNRLLFSLTESTVTPDPVDIKTPVSSPNETEESEGLSTVVIVLLAVLCSLAAILAIILTLILKGVLNC